MALTRRRMVQLSAAGAVAVATGIRTAAAGSATDDVRANALRFFGARGFVEKPPLSMLTDAAFNGGLRYDETRPEPVAIPAVSVQPAARVDDIAERSRPGVLASFTIFGVARPGPAEPGAMLSDVMGFLLSERKLDLDRMLFVSTSHFRPLIGRLEGVTAERFLERPMDEARAAGDGSGFFAPAGHPDRPDYATVGVYYRVPGASGVPTSYPPEDHIEIAEVGIVPSGGDPDAPQIGGFGIERVAMAEGENVPNFEETRLNLLRIIEDEAERTGKELPPGYRMFASL